jgi:hypothetical protein
VAALALEVNDAGLLALSAGASAPEPESPGLALFEDDHVRVGAEAAARAFLSPRLVHQRFWDPLDQQPLRRPFPRRLTAADLAHAELLALAQGLAHAPDEVLLAVPGFWTKEALGLLLGVARAAGLPVKGLVDAAVAATTVVAARGERLLHLDLTRHRAVLTVLTRTDEIACSRVVDLDGFGTSNFQGRLAETVARHFVATTRFDPLHSAAAEQALHAALPEWLTELRSNETCSASLTAGEREHRVELPRGLLEEGVSDLYGALLAQASALVPVEGGELLVSGRASGLPGLVDRLRSLPGIAVLELPRDAALVGTLRGRDHIRYDANALPFVTRLPLAGSSPALHPRAGQRPTHLLNGGSAHRLAPEGLAIGTAPPLGRRGLGLRQEGVVPHHCSLRFVDGEVLLDDHSGGATLLNGAPVGAAALLRAGDRLRLGPSVELVLIATEGEEE